MFTETEGIIFRRHVRVGEGYRDVRPIDKWWEGTEPCLRTLRGRVLTSAEEIFEAMQQRWQQLNSKYQAKGNKARR